YSIRRAHQLDVAPAINDHLRLDRHRDATSVSIAFPNCQLFFKYRSNSQGIDWVVLGLNPAILWEKDCAFCRRNAASSEISKQPLPQLKTLESFLGMFEELRDCETRKEGCKTRKEQKLDSFYPTDVQAEVLVFDVIEPQYITEISFDRNDVYKTYLPHLGARDLYLCQKNKQMFGFRDDILRDD
ncbi:MAG: DUF4433 domain-containing protein, partial [Alphaproteobacteria bacterium]|nr:DUF4433 domain-containing protein [Alphaproteobacteria bacterium]